MRRQANSSGWKILLFVGFTGVAIVGSAGFFVWKKNQRRDAFVPPDRTAERVEAETALQSPPPDPTQALEFERFFAELVAALVDPNAEVMAHFDLGRMYDEMRTFGAFNELTVREESRAKPAFVKGGQARLSQSLRTRWKGLIWKRTSIRRVRLIAGGNEAVAFVVHDTEDGVRIKMRWWLIRKPDGPWAIYDFEDLDVGIRGSQAAGIAMLDSKLDLRRLTEINKFSHVPEALFSLRKNELENARKELDECKGVRFPGAFADLYEVAEAYYDLATAKLDESLARLDRVVARNPDLPCAFALRSLVNNHLGNHDRSADDAEKYLKQLGPDSEVLLLLAYAREGQERPEDAAAAYLQALELDPELVEAWNGWRRMLPLAEKEKLGVKFANSPNVEAIYDELMRLAREDKDTLGIQALAAALLRALPQDYRGHTEGIAIAARAGNIDSATALYRAAELAVSKDQRQQILSSYLWALAAANQHLTAYRSIANADAKAAYAILTDDLAEQLDDYSEDEPEPDEASRKLRTTLDALTADHRKRAPSDPRSDYHDARSLLRTLEYEKAEKLIAASMAKFERSRPAREEDADLEWMFRHQRVQALFHLNKGLQAYADLAPAEEVFGQLAYLYHAKPDPNGLRELLAKHEKKCPSDPRPIYWASALEWDADKFESAIPLMRSYLAKRPKEKGEFFDFEWVCNDRLIRGLVRLGRTREAREFLDGLAAPGIIHRAIVLCAEEKYAEACVLLVDEATKNSWLANGFYADADLGSNLSKVQFQTFREKFPPPPAKPAIIR